MCVNLVKAPEITVGPMAISMKNKLTELEPFLSHESGPHR